MAKNISNDSKTIKTTLSSISSDIWNISRTCFYGNYNDQGIVINGSILENYKDYFDKKLVETDVDEKFFYSPSYFSEHYYGTPDLDFLIMYFAGVTSLFQFNKKRIKVLPKTALLELSQLMLANEEKVSASYNKPDSYIKMDEIDEKSKIKQ